MVLPRNNSAIARNENEVSNGCGYCSEQSCTDYTYLDCMLCKDFVTTIERKRYFEEQIKVIDYKIQNASVIYDKEDLINIKRLLLCYLEEIINLKESLQDNNK
jgi:hypothetical protein